MGSFNNYVDIFYAEHGHEQKLAFHGLPIPIFSLEL